MAGLIHCGLGEMSSAFLPPSLHIGRLPLDSHLNTGCDDYQQPVVFMWDIQTKCDVTWTFAFDTTNKQVRREFQTYWPNDNHFLEAWTDQSYCWGYRNSITKVE